MKANANKYYLIASKRKCIAFNVENNPAANSK